MRQKVVIVLVEVALAIAAYVFLKPLIGFWCYIPTGGLIYLSVVATVEAVVTHFSFVGGPGPLPDVPAPESDQPEDQ